MRPTGKRRYRYVTPAENELMHSLYNAGVSMAEIARRLNRHPGSVDRILHPNVPRGRRACAYTRHHFGHNNAKGEHCAMCAKDDEYATRMLRMRRGSHMHLPTVRPIWWWVDSCPPPLRGAARGETDAE